MELKDEVASTYGNAFVTNQDLPLYANKQKLSLGHCLNAY